MKVGTMGFAGLLLQLTPTGVIYLCQVSLVFRVYHMDRVTTPNHNIWY
jgi:hypothetical protein